MTSLTVIILGLFYPKNPESLEEWEVYWELSHRTGVALTLPGGTLDPTTRPSKFDVLALLMPEARIPLKDIAEIGQGHIFESVQVKVEPPRVGQTDRFRIIANGYRGAVANRCSRDLPGNNTAISMTARPTRIY